MAGPTHLFIDGSVPIVGQSFKVIGTYSTAIVQCQCDAKALLVMTGKMQPCACRACGRAYVIADSGQITIGEFTAPSNALTQ